MYLDAGKFGLLVALLVGVYFGWNPWWVPAVMASWLYSLFIYVPFLGRKRRAAMAAQQAVAQKAYLDALAGRDIKPEELN